MERQKQAKKNVTELEKKKAVSVEDKNEESIKSEKVNTGKNVGENVVNSSLTEKEEEKTAEGKEVSTFIADTKDKRPKDYASRVQIAACYTDDQAKNMLRKKISQCKEVHLRFLKKIEEPSAFKIEKLFIPVHCGKADVRYSWKTTVNKVESWHEEICTRENRYSSAIKSLDVMNFSLDDVTTATEKKNTELLENNGGTFKTTTHKFNAFLKETAPAKRAEIEKHDETYTLVYVPIMKTTCTLDGEKYVGYVNLYNGACDSAYKVSDVVANAAEKTSIAAQLAKRTLLDIFLFTLVLCFLTFFSGLKSVGWHFGSLTVKTVVTTCLLGGLAVPSLLLLLGVNALKKEALIEKTIRTGKRPTSTWARFSIVLGAICSVVAIVLFFLKVMT